MKYLIIIALMGLMACSGDQDKRVSRENISFDTSDDSELFFKNTRQTSYNHQNIQGTVDIYRMKQDGVHYADDGHGHGAGYTGPEDHAMLIPAIAAHWNRDKAYILLETNQYLYDEDSIIVKWTDPATDNSGDYIMADIDREENLKTAVDIYTSMQDGHSFEVRVNGKYEPLFAEEGERELFRKTMLDYFRLVNAIR